MVTYLYWIRCKEHTDIISQGYVGITTNFEKRMEKHRNCKDESLRLYNAIKKYGWENLIKTIMLEGSEEYCLNIENNLRSSKRIGWNIAIGGGKPPIMFGADNPSRNPQVIVKRQKTRDLRTIPYENIARGENHPRIKNPELYAHLKGVKRNINAAKGDNHPRRKNPEKWNNLIGENHPRVKTPHLWTNATGENHWTKNNPEFSERMKNNNPMHNLNIVTRFKGKNNPAARKVKCIESNEIFDTIKDAANSVNGNVANICAVCRGKLKTSSGFHWEYVL